MTFAIEWLALHIFGVLVAFALLVIVFRKEDTNYKGELILTIACCLVTLVAKSIYIDRKSTRLNSSHMSESRMPSSA